MSRMDAFEKELEQLINKHSLENDSNTPDYILARFLRECLETFNDTSRARETWYGKELRPGKSVGDLSSPGS